MEALHEQSSFSLAVGVNIQAQVTPTFAAGLGASFGVETVSDRQSYVARYAHRYFTVDIDLPARPSDLFEEYPDLSSTVSPVYVSSVTYGRMVLFNLQSTYTSLRIHAALNAAVDLQDRLMISANLATEHQNALNNSTINSTVIGGAARFCSGVSTIAGLVDCVRQGGLRYQDGVPIAYTLRFLKNNEVARVVLSSEYTARQCQLTSVDSQVTKRFQLVGISGANNDAEAFSPNRYELRGQILLRPTAETVGNKGGCTDAEAGNSAYKSILDTGGRDLEVGAGLVNLENNNYRASLVFPGGQTNLSICTRLFDRDFFADGFGQNNRIYQRQVIDPSSITSGTELALNFAQGTSGSSGSATYQISIRLGME